jgi:hypothetical protein
MPGTIRPPTEMPSESDGPRSLRELASAQTHASPLSLSRGSGAHHPRTSSPDGRATPKVCAQCGARYPVEFKVCPQDATELVDDEPPADDDDLVGSTLASTYRITRVLGEGGMGRVYEARHTRIGSKRFAIKMLHPEYTRQPDVMSRFQREAEAAATIKSPYVMGVYDVDRTADGRPYMVGEFLEGIEFAERLEQLGKMSVPDAVRVVRQVCKALVAAHKEGIVHRDMKPENVFLTGDDTLPVARVLDFGISKVGDNGKSGLTKTGMIMGTPSYMAPEQARGERVDHRVDVYAVGAVLYTALTGQRPFDKVDPTATLTAVLIEEPPPPRSLEPSIPEALEMVIQKAMSKEPSGRYQTMAELDAALAPWDTLVGGESAALGVATSSGVPGGALVASANRQAHEVSMARPIVALTGTLGAFWVLASLTTLLAAFLRFAHGEGTNVTASEAVLLSLVVLFALATPLALGARALKKIWTNTPKIVELSQRLYLPVLVGLSAYGLTMLAIRFLEVILLRRAAGVAWAMWDVLTVPVGAVSAYLADRARRS